MMRNKLARRFESRVKYDGMICSITILHITILRKKWYEKSSQNEGVDCTMLEII